MPTTDERYQAAVKDFESATTAGIRLSRAVAGRDGVPQPAWWGSVLYTRLCVIAMSILCLTPRSRFATRIIDHYDFSAAASLTRNLWECYFVFFYLCADEVDEDQWLTRLNVFQLHDCLTRFKMFKEMRNDDPQLPEFLSQAAELRQRIARRAFFAGFAERRRDHILRGDNPLLLSQDELLQRMGENVGHFRGLYRFLSAHVHTLPLAIYRMAEREQGRGTESDWEKGHIATALEFGLVTLERAAADMRRLFPNVGAKME